MNQRPRQILCELIAHYGPELSDDPARCVALLRDLCAADKAEVNLLQLAQRKLVAQELRRYIGALPHELLLARLRESLVAEHMIVPEGAEWAVESWALALNIPAVEPPPPAPSVSSSDASDDVSIDDETWMPPEPLARRASGPPAKWSFVRLISAVRERFHLFRKQTDSVIGRGMALVQPRPATAPAPPPPVRRRGRAEVVLQLKRPLDQRLEGPLWFTDQIKLLRTYILPERTDLRPVVLTGYESFGGTSIINWAVAQAADEIKARVRSTGPGVMQVSARVERPESGKPSLQLDDWLAEVNAPCNEKFREHFAHLFDYLQPQPFFEPEKIRAVKREEDNAGHPNLNIPTPIGTISAGPGKDGYFQEAITGKPKEKPARIQELLYALNHELPTESGREASHQGLPCRIVVVVDKLEDWRLLECLEPFRPPYAFKSLRIIAVLNKHGYDRCVSNNPGGKRELRRGGRVVTCMPLWDKNIARDLCRFYFDLDEKQLGDPLVKAFVKGLNFRSRGLPGNLTRLIDEHVGESGAGEVVLNRVTVGPWRTYARAADLLKRQWKELLAKHMPEGALGNLKSDAVTSARMFIYTVADHALSLHLEGGRDLLDSCRELAKESNWNLPGVSTDGLCEDVYTSLRDNKLISSAPVAGRRRGGVESDADAGERGRRAVEGTRDYIH